MDDGDRFLSSGSDPWFAPSLAPPFIAPNILAEADLPASRRKLAAIIETVVLPRIIEMHATRPSKKRDDPQTPTSDEIAKLAMLVLNPDLELSSEFIRQLEDRGLSIDRLFIDLLEPAARCLGTMWDNDECSFIDVTLGVARLQQLLALFSRSWAVPAFSRKRRVCMVSIAEEQHSFGVTMVETFLRAGGWDVRSERGATLQQIAPLLRSQWLAVVGLTASTDRQLGSLAATIRHIRQHSRNPVVGIMVGGPPFTACPELATQVGADAMAINAPAAVVLAQRLFDIGAKTNWQDSFAAG
jgi:methanogenic corrinoid protein MtbC1